MRKLLLALGLFGLLLPGCAASFSEFSPPDGKFSILMPGTPEKKTKIAKGLKNITYGADAGNNAYSVSYADLPNDNPYDLSEHG